MSVHQELSEYEKQSLATLNEIVRWIRLQGKQQAKNIIENLLNSETKRLIFHLSDGRSSPTIAKVASVDPTTVRNYWKEWAVEGIADIHPHYRRRYVKTFSLEEFGIEPPEIPKTTKRIEDKSTGPKKGKLEEKK